MFGELGILRVSPNLWGISVNVWYLFRLFVCNMRCMKHKCMRHAWDVLYWPNPPVHFFRV